MGKMYTVYMLYILLCHFYGLSNLPKGKKLQFFMKTVATYHIFFDAWGVGDFWLKRSSNEGIHLLGGGFKYVLFSPLLGEGFQFD